MIKGPVQLIDGVGTKRIAHLGAIKSNPDYRKVFLGTIRIALHTAVIRNIKKVIKAFNGSPLSGIKGLGNLVRNLAHLLTISHANLPRRPRTPPCRVTLESVCIFCAVDHPV